jgi:hypothetical protein
MQGKEQSSPDTAASSGNSATDSPQELTQQAVRATPGKSGHLPKLKGHIELIIGPMFAGKSTELLRRMKRLEVAGNKCLRVKYSEDTRYSSDKISTHDK